MTDRPLSARPCGVLDYCPRARSLAHRLPARLQAVQHTGAVGTPRWRTIDERLKRRLRYSPSTSQFLFRRDFPLLTRDLPIYVVVYFFVLPARRLKFRTELARGLALPAEKTRRRHLAGIREGVGIQPIEFELPAHTLLSEFRPFGRSGGGRPSPSPARPPPTPRREYLE
jgi:hypothetical protein